MTPEDVFVQLQAHAGSPIAEWLTTHRKRVTSVLQKVHPAITIPALRGTQDHARKVEPTEADMQKAREDHKGLRNFNWRQAVEHGEAKIAELLRAGAAAEARRAELFAEADRRLRMPHSSPTAGASQRAEGREYAKMLDNIAHELVAERTFLYLAREKLATKKPAPKRALSSTISGHLGPAKPNPYTTGDRWVYAVELSPAAAPNARGPVVYVGQTALHPRERFERHKAGGMHASDVVTRYGVHLLPERSGPWVGEIEAERAERALATELRRRGVTVMGGH